MKKIEECELKQINGGGLSGWAIAGISALGTLLIGVLNGIVHPTKCN